VANAGVVPTLAELRNLAKKYQERLQLDDWQIRVKLSRSADVKGFDGYVLWAAESKTATIILRRTCRIEATLRHEFMHVAIEGRVNKLVRNAPEYEAALDVIAERILA
jgi:hypothetical protein